MNFQEKINNSLKAFKDAYMALEDTVTEIDSDNKEKSELISQLNNSIAGNNKEKERALKAMKRIRSLID